jgi:DNA-binding CsgD family transcriptional regulator
MHLSRADFDRFAKFLPDFYALQDLKTFPQHVAALVPRLIPVDTSAYNEVNLRERRVKIVIQPSAESFGVTNFIASARASMHEHPLIEYYARTFDSRALRLSDFMSRRFRRSRLYNEIFRPIGIEHLVTIPVKTPQADDHIAISLSRERTNFSERDREMLELLRPHFIQAHINAWAVSSTRRDLQETRDALEDSLGATSILVRNDRIVQASRRAIALLAKYAGAMPSADRLPDAIVCRWRHWRLSLANGHAAACTSMALECVTGARLIVRIIPRTADSYVLLLTEQAHPEDPIILVRQLGLSPREAEVLLWIARGKTNPEVAAIMSLSRRTVDKHLEHIYPKLRVESRVAAASIAWDVLRGLRRD